MSGPGRNDPCPCGSGQKYKRCHGIKEWVRLTVHLPTDRDHRVFVLMVTEGAAEPELIPPTNMADNMVEAFLEPDEDAFESGVSGAQLLTPEGRERFLEWCRAEAAIDDGHGERHIQIASRNKMMGFGVPCANVVDVTAATWTDL